MNPQPFASSHLVYFFGLVRLLIQHNQWGEVIKPCHLCGAAVLVTFHHHHCPPVGTTGSGCMVGGFLNPQPFASSHLWHFFGLVRLFIQHHQWGEVMKPCHLCGAAVLVTFHHHHYPSVGTTGCMVGGFLNPQPFASSHLWYFFGLVRLLIQHCRWGEVIKPCHLCGAAVLVTFHHHHCPPVGTTGCMVGGFLNPQPFTSSHLWCFFGLVRLLIQHYRWGEVIKPCHLCGAAVLVTFHHHHCPPVGTTGSGCMVGGFLNPQPFASSHLWHFFGLVRLLIQHYQWGEVMKPYHLCGAAVLVTFHHHHYPSVGTTGCMVGGDF